MATFYIKETDRSPRIQTTLTDPAGTVIDLTGKTVHVEIARLTSSTLDTDTTAIVEDAVNGVVSYSYGDGEAVFGVYKAQWVVNRGQATQETYPNYGYDTINIERGL